MIFVTHLQTLFFHISYSYISASLFLDQRNCASKICFLKTWFIIYQKFKSAMIWYMATKMLSIVHHTHMSDIIITYTLLYSFGIHSLASPLSKCWHIVSEAIIITVCTVWSSFKFGRSQSFISRSVMTITIQWFFLWCTTWSIPFEESTLKK